MEAIKTKADPATEMELEYIEEEANSCGTLKSSKRYKKPPSGPRKRIQLCFKQWKKLSREQRQQEFSNRIKILHQLQYQLIHEKKFYTWIQREQQSWKS